MKHTIIAPSITRSRRATGVGRAFLPDWVGQEWPTYLLVAVFALAAAPRVLAGTSNAQSDAFRVDTRTNDTVRVTELSCRYCNGAYGVGGKSVCFLAGVDLWIDFEAKVDWGPKTASQLEFNGTAQDWSSATRSLNVGALGNGGQLVVVAVASDGTRRGQGGLGWRDDLRVVRFCRVARSAHRGYNRRHGSGVGGGRLSSSRASLGLGGNPPTRALPARQLDPSGREPHGTRGKE